MHKMLILLCMLLPLLFLAGCDKDKQPVKETSEESIQSVEWFKEHPAERDAQMAKCQANPNMRMMSTNCLNATKAMTAAPGDARDALQRQL